MLLDQLFRGLSSSEVQQVRASVDSVPTPLPSAVQSNDDVSEMLQEINTNSFNSP